MSAETTWADVGVALVGVSVAVAEAVAHTEPCRWDAAPAQQALDGVDAAEARARLWGAPATREELVRARGLRSRAATSDRGGAQAGYTTDRAALARARSAGEEL